MSLISKIKKSLQGPPGPQGPMGATNTRLVVEFKDCTMCGQVVECVRMGKFLYLCPLCEFKLAERLKLIIQLE